MEVKRYSGIKKIPKADILAYKKGKFSSYGKVVILENKSTHSFRVVKLNFFERFLNFLIPFFGVKEEFYFKKRLHKRKIELVPKSKIDFKALKKRTKKGIEKPSKPPSYIYEHLTKSEFVPANKILTEQAKINPKVKLFRENNVSPKSGVPFITMEGVSIMADVLAEKNNFDNLFVCESLDAFSKKLDEVKNMKDGKLALVVPTYQPSCTCKKKKGCKDPDHKVQDYHNQHKISVLIEKKEGKTKIFTLDSASYDPLDMEDTYLDDGESFGCTELLHAYLRDKNLPNASYYYNLGVRQYAHGGCETFALRDCVGFLKEPNFFERVEERGFMNKGAAGDLDHPIYVKNLPPNFMKVAQSMKVLEAYREENPGKEQEGHDLNEKLGTHQRTLDETLKKHTIIDPKTGKELNFLISARADKYMNYLLKFLKENSEKEIQKKINKRLLK